jgi:hypothetical protein
MDILHGISLIVCVNPHHTRPPINVLPGFSPLTGQTILDVIERTGRNKDNGGIIQCNHPEVLLYISWNEYEVLVL